VYIEQVGDRTLADCKVLIVDDQASSRLVLETSAPLWAQVKKQLNIASTIRLT